jgi:hypothetical protein
MGLRPALAAHNTTDLHDGVESTTGSTRCWDPECGRDGPSLFQEMDFSAADFYLVNGTSSPSAITNRCPRSYRTSTPRGEQRFSLKPIPVPYKRSGDALKWSYDTWKIFSQGLKYGALLALNQKTVTGFWPYNFLPLQNVTNYSLLALPSARGVPCYKTR